MISNTSIDTFRGAALRSGVPAAASELTNEQIKRTVTHVRARLNMFKRSHPPSPSLELLGSDLALGAQTTMMDLVGRAPLLGQSAKHGA